MTARSFVALAEDYLALRRSLGFSLSDQGRMLLHFARFADRSGHRGPLTVDLAVRWSESCAASSPARAARRLSVVRGFARHRAAFDAATEIPTAGAFGRGYVRRPPYIYSDEEIAALVRATATLRPRGGTRAPTFATLFCLLAATALRISEALALRDGDVDLRERVLTVRQSTFRKSRLVPLHPSAVEPLRRYAALRAGCLDGSDAFFRIDGARVPYATVCSAFGRLRRRLGWTEQGLARLPRVHDLRHTAAVRRLLLWSKEGVEIDRRMLHLATYLGHAHVTDTYWYLSAVPELMALTAQRFEAFARREEERAS